MKAISTEKSIMDIIGDMRVRANALKEVAVELRKASQILRKSTDLRRQEKESKGVDIIDHVRPDMFIVFDK